MVTAVIYLLVTRWRSQRSQKRVLALFCSRNLLRSSPGEREKQATAIKVIITELSNICMLIFCSISGTEMSNTN